MSTTIPDGFLQVQVMKPGVDLVRTSWHGQIPAVLQRSLSEDGLSYTEALMMPTERELQIFRVWTTLFAAEAGAGALPTTILPMLDHPHYQIFDVRSSTLGTFLPRSTNARCAFRAQRLDGTVWARSGGFNAFMTRAAQSARHEFIDEFVASRPSTRAEIEATFPVLRPGPRLTPRGAINDSLAGIFGGTPSEAKAFEDMAPADRMAAAGVTEGWQLLLFTTNLPLRAETTHHLLQGSVTAFDPTTGTFRIPIARAEELGLSLASLRAHKVVLRKQGLIHLSEDRGELIGTLTGAGAAEFKRWNTAR